MTTLLLCELSDLVAAGIEVVVKQRAAKCSRAAEVVTKCCAWPNTFGPNNSGRPQHVGDEQSRRLASFRP